MMRIRNRNLPISIFGIEFVTEGRTTRMSRKSHFRTPSISLLGLTLTTTLLAATPARASDLVDTLKAQSVIPASVGRTAGPTITTSKSVFKSLFYLGGGADLAYGMVEKYKVRDPILTLRDEFLEGLKSDPGLSNFRIHADYLGPKEAKRKNLKNTFSEPYVLHFGPGEWEIIYFASKFKRYRSSYWTKAQLIRTSDGKRVWRGRCVVQKNDKKSAPTLDELTSNANDVFVNWASESGSECAKQLLEKFRKDNA